MSKPVRLSDDEMSAVLAAAHPIPVHARDAFLQSVAASLAGLSEIGPGCCLPCRVGTAAAVLRSARPRSRACRDGRAVAAMVCARFD
jgi:hypothetical protein